MENNDLKLLIALARTHNAVFSRIEKHISDFDLTISEFGVLEYLFHKGKNSVQAIAEKILVTSGTITYIIDKLSRKGLVVRVRCESDKRIYYIELTEKGHQLIAEIFPKHEHYLNELFNGLDYEKKDQLITLLFELKEVI